MHLGGNRNARNNPIGPDGKRGWSYGFFDCFGRFGLCKFDPNQNASHFSTCRPTLILPVGCLSCWCPCVVYSKNKQRLHSLQAQGIPLAGGGDTVDTSCFIYSALSFTGYSWAMQVCSDVNKMHMGI
jgi:hypothetical protein